jgi:hypothetical protein
MRKQEEQELKERFKPSAVQRVILESHIRTEFEKEFCEKCPNRDCGKCYIKLGVDSAINSVNRLVGEVSPEVHERAKWIINEF